MAAVAIPIHGFGDLQASSLHLDSESIWANIIRFNPIVRLFEFCAGILTARAYVGIRNSHAKLVGRGYLLYIPALFGIFVLLLLSRKVPYPLLHNGLLMPVNCLLVVGVALGGGPFARFLSRSPVVLLGNASYSLYILHTPIASWMAFVFSVLFSRKVLGIGWATVYLVLTIVISVVVFKKLEEPANRSVKARLRNRLLPKLASSDTGPGLPLARATRT
jgi:peptidoglycan/LPS O-acetylase OafA/YrhL